MACYYGDPHMLTFSFSVQIRSEWKHFFYFLVNLTIHSVWMLKIKRQWLLQSYASGFLFLFSYIVDM